MTQESLALGRWLTARLKTDTVLAGMGVYRGLAPQGGTLPYVVWQIQTGEDILSAGQPAYAMFDVVVKVVSDDRGDKGVEDAINRITTLLHEVRTTYVYVKANGTTDTFRIIVRRGGTVDYLETATGQRLYRHQGRMWRITVASD